MGKPPELRTEDVVSEGAKKVIEDVKRIAEGSIYVYQWNIDKSDASPLGLYVDPPKVEATCDALEQMGSTKSEIKDGFKFNLNLVTGFQGSHMEIYRSGKIQVKWPKQAKTRNTPDFVTSSFLDVIDGIAKVLKESSILPTDHLDSNIEANNKNAKANSISNAKVSSANPNNTDKVEASHPVSYIVMPIILKNRIDPQVKHDPKALFLYPARNETRSQSERDQSFALGRYQSDRCVTA